VLRLCMGLPANAPWAETLATHYYSSVVRV